MHRGISHVFVLALVLAAAVWPAVPVTRAANTLLGPGRIIQQQVAGMGELTVVKDLVPAGDSGKFNLFIMQGAATFASAADVGDGGTAGPVVLNPGTFQVSETAGTGTDLNSYTTSISCNTTAGTGVGSSSNAGPLNVVVNAGDNVVCTITNTRLGTTGRLEVKKDLNPATDSGLFNLFIRQSAATIASALNMGDNGSTGEITVTPGTFQVSETAGTGTSLANYTSSISCQGNNGTGVVVASSSTAGPLSVVVAAGDDIVCTISNTRLATTGRLEVKKDLNPATDSGLFNLFIMQSAATIASALNMGDTGSTGEITVTPGTFQVSETAGTGTSLASYTSSISCQGNNGTGVVVASSSTAGPLSVVVAAGDDIVCTISNTRLATTGKLEVKKDLNPATDPGLFNLVIMQSAATIASALNMGDAGSTGEITVTPGTFQVSETAGTGTSLASYTSSISCLDSAGVVVASSSGTGPLSVVVDAGDDIVCTITNTRVGTTGKLEVEKDLNPASDPGLFNLVIMQSAATIASALNVGDAGSTGEITVTPGTFQVSETAGTGTSLASYTSSISCRDNNGAGVVVASSSGTGPLSVVVDAGDDVVCTITNTRIGTTGKLEVEKDLNPATDSGLFNLFIMQSAATIASALNVGDNGSTGEITVTPGTFQVSETAGAGTSLANYTSGISCRDNNGAGVVVVSSSSAGPLSVVVAAGADIRCTISNTRVGAPPAPGTASLSGRVTNEENGQPIAGAMILLRLEDDDRRDDDDDDDELKLHATTDANGSYSFTQLVPDVYRLKVRAERFHNTQVRDIMVTANETKVVDVALRPKENQGRNEDDDRPGCGNGDDNHGHSGPSGRSDPPGCRNLDDDGDANDHRGGGNSGSGSGSSSGNNASSSSSGGNNASATNAGSGNSGSGGSGGNSGSGGRRGGSHGADNDGGGDRGGNSGKGGGSGRGGGRG